MSNQTQSEPNYLRDIAYFIMVILSELFLTVYSFHFWTWKWCHDDSETSFVIIVYFYLSMYIKTFAYNYSVEQGNCFSAQPVVQ